MLFIASLFVVSESLDATGVTAWAGQQLVARVGESRTRLLVLMLLLVAVLTALISVNGAVAALVPVAVVTALRLQRSPSASCSCRWPSARTPARCWRCRGRR